MLSQTNGTMSPSENRKTRIVVEKASSNSGKRE